MDVVCVRLLAVMRGICNLLCGYAAWSMIIIIIIIILIIIIIYHNKVNSYSREFNHLTRRFKKTQTYLSQQLWPFVQPADKCVNGYHPVPQPELPYWSSTVYQSCSSCSFAQIHVIPPSIPHWLLGKLICITGNVTQRRNISWLWKF